MKPKLLLCLALTLGGALFHPVGAQSAQPSLITQARAFVAECLHRTNVFVMNPPADANPYRDLSPAERLKWMQRAQRDGATLTLYLNGLPQHYQSNKQFKPNGLSKGWHANGQLASVEHYDDGKLVTGQYYDEHGTLLGAVTNGAGRRVVLQGVGQAWFGHLQNGVQIVYGDRVNGREKISETHFRNGRRNGTSIQWSNGHKRSETHFKNGIQEGVAIGWDASGRTNSITHFRHGQLDGLCERFFPNTRTAEQIVYAANRIVSRKSWYANGVLASEESRRKNGLEAKSYDFSGQQTGAVNGGNGILITQENSVLRMNQNGPFYPFYLRTFTNGRKAKRQTLPSLVMNPSRTSPASNSVAFYLEVLPMKSVKAASVSLQLPKGVTSESSLSFAATNIPASVGVTFRAFNLKFPVPYAQWSGRILGNLDVKMDGRWVHYQTIALNKEVSRALRPEPSQTAWERKPRNLTSDLYYMLRGQRPNVALGQVPPFQHALDMWGCGNGRWLLYAQPPLLLWSHNRGKDWQMVRKKFSYEPQGMACWSARHILVWGTKPTKTPNHGIPFVIEQSANGGKTWRRLKARLPIDYLLGIRINEHGMFVTGIRLPKSGVPKGTDWFELPETSLMSSGGKTFTEWAGPDIFGRGRPAAKSVAPNGTARAYLFNDSFWGQSFSLYAARNLAEIPKPIASSPTQPKIVWSGNSRIVALQTNGVFTACGDLMRQPIEPIFFYGTDKERNSKIEHLLELNQ